MILPFSIDILHPWWLYAEDSQVLMYLAAVVDVMLQQMREDPPAIKFDCLRFKFADVCFGENLFRLGKKALHPFPMFGHIIAYFFFCRSRSVRSNQFD